MIEAELPDGTVLEFPEGTSQDVIQRTVKSRLGIKPQATQEPSLLQKLGKDVADYARRSVVKNLNRAAGAVEGAGSIGATLLTPYDLLAGNTQSIGNPERRQAIEQGLQSMGADPKSADFQAAKILTQFAGTAGVGGALAKGLSLIPSVTSRAPALINALTTQMVCLISILSFIPFSSQYQQCDYRIVC